MANITRIQNNQIYSSTIQAYQKIVPGSITGNLFAPSVTINSNISVIGNLTVSGDTSQINSVNTYVNDPLVVFNNGYSGSLSGYDIGMLINRNLGSLAPYGSVNTAWVWVENDQAFEAIATTETGTNVSSINNSGWANVKVGNLTAVSTSITAATASSSYTSGALVVTGGVGIGGKLYTNNTANINGNVTITAGGALVTSQTTGYLYNETVTTLNIGAAATTINAGNDSGTTNLLGILKVGGNIVAAATTSSTNTTSGALVVKGGAGIAENLNVGGTLTVTGQVTNTANLAVNGGGITTTAATGYLFNETATTLNIGRAATAVTLGSTTGTVTINNPTLVGTQTTQAVYNTVATTVNAFGAATTLNMGAATGTLTISNPTITGTNATALNLNGANPTVATTSTGTVTLFNTAATTVNAFGAATTINAGNAGGTTNLLGILKVGGNIVATATTGSSNTTTGALVVKGGAGIAADLNVGGSLTLGGNLYVNGTVEYVNSIITTHQDPILELNTGANAAALTGTAFDSGIKTHYWTGAADATAFFGRTNDTGYFEYYSLATESGNVMSGTYGTIKSGNLIAATSTTSTSNSTGALVVAGGAGIGGNLNVGVYNTSLHNIQGNVLFGTGPIVQSADTIITINQNNTAPIVSNATVHLSAADNHSAIYGADSFGVIVSSVVHMRHARGTAAAPSAVQTTDVLGGLSIRGYGATGFASGNVATHAGVTAIASQNFTDTAQGTTLNLNFVPIGTVAADVGMSIRANGSTIFPQTLESTSYTDGSVVFSGGVGIAKVTNHGGNVVISSGTNMTSATTGALLITGQGGASIGGNVYMAQNLYIGSSALGTSLLNPTVVATDTGSTYAQMAMLNTSSTGSADIVTYGNNGDDTGAWMDMGFTGTGFNDTNYTITKANDGYLFARPKSTYGGNLVIATSEAGTYNDVVIGVGSFLSSSEVARFHGNASNSGTFVVKLPTNAVPAANTGAFQVWGGGSFSSNLYVGGAVTLNGSQTAANDVLVKGVNDSTLIWARPNASYDQVIIGNSATASTAIRGAKLIVNSTDSILLPVGTNAQRPSSTGGTDTAGMFRFNTTLNGLEYYNGSSWQAITTQFTVIVDQQFNGDGTTTNFTLSQNSTTAGIIVSINGVLQIPTLAYSVTGGTTLSFTEAPISGDVIDVRMLTTTQTVSGIASTNGYMQFQTVNGQAQVWTGSSSTAVTTYWNSTGAQVSSLANVSVASANTATTIDTIDNTAYRSAKYIIQVTNSTGYQVQEALVISNGTTATVVTYGTVQTNGNLGIVSATQSGTNTLVQFTAANASNVVRIKKDYLEI